MSTLAPQFWRNIVRVFSLPRSIDLAGALGEGFQKEVPDLSAALTRGVAWGLGPAKAVLSRIGAREGDLALEAGITEAQSYSLKIYGTAIRQLVGMIDEAAETRLLLARETGAAFRWRAMEFGANPFDDVVWGRIRDEITSGRPVHPMAVEVKMFLDKIDPAMQRIMPGWKGLPNYWPNYANAKKISEVGEGQYRALVEATMGADNLKAMLIDPDIHKAYTRAFLREPTKDDLVELAIASTMRKPPRTRPDMIASVKPASHLLMHRRVNLPPEYRLHPYEEITTYLDDVTTWMADTRALGPRGERANALIKLLQGKMGPDLMSGEARALAGASMSEDLAALSPEIQGILANMGTTHRVSHPGVWTVRAGDAAETILRYTMGVFDETEAVGGLRTTLGAMGTMTMMVFSAIPNLGQIYNEVIHKGFAQVLRGVWAATAPGLERDRIRMLAASVGQGQAYTRVPDALYGVGRITEIMGKEGVWGLMKNPAELGPLARRAYDLLQRSYHERGMQGASRRAADYSLRLSGFASVEDWLRRSGLASWVDELQRLQGVVKANPKDPTTLRALRRVGVVGEDDVAKFAKMELRREARSFQEILNLTPEKFLQVEDWQRLYLHAIDQTQFNYMPMEFPILWSVPWVGSVIAQFRRFSYEQARKIVGMTIEEARHGNIVPVTRLLAGAGIIGGVVSALRDTASGKDLYWLPATPEEGATFKKIKRPAVERAAQARGPLGITIPEWAWERVTDAVAMGMLGLYTDALFTMSEGKPIVVASWMIGIYPTEVFNLVNRMAQAGTEVITGGERDPRKERFPKTREFGRAIIRQIPLAPVRFAQPHLFRGPGGDQRMREAGIRAAVSHDWVSFNHINNVFINREDPDPITVREIQDYMTRVALRQLGLTTTGPARGEPGYKPRRAVPYDETREAEAMRKAEERVLRTMGKMETFEEEE